MMAVGAGLIVIRNSQVISQLLFYSFLYYFMDSISL